MSDKQTGGVIFGIDTDGYNKVYRVLLYEYDGLHEWSFLRRKVTEEELINALITKKVDIKNAYVIADKTGKYKVMGKTGSLDRFRKADSRSGSNPIVIISELVTSSGRLLGYKVVTYDGVVSNKSLIDIINYCEKSQGSKCTPIQNGQFVSDGTKKSHIRNYPGDEYIKETLVRKASKNAKPAQINKKEASKAVSKLEEIFTPEQIIELKIGKKNGVDIRIYGNNKLSPEQMKVIREGLEDGLNAKLFADPEFGVNAMRLYRADLKYGVDISMYLNPKYNAEQISELSLGYQSGVDVSQYADPSLGAEEMAERRMRLENKIWKEHKVKDDSSWK